MSDKKLNQEQLKAIRHSQGPLLIIAGAGTGKTTVITERIKYLISQELAKPAEILALTFTEKAALEMEERVDQLVPYGYTQMWISTFHSFCDRVLRDEALQIGLDPKYTLMTQAETVQFLKNNLFKFKLKYFRPHGNPTKFLPGLLTHFSRLRDEDIAHNQYLDWVKLQISNSKFQKEEKEKNSELAQSYKTYQQLKLKQGLMDFADLISNTLSLFRTRKNVLTQYQKKFKYFLVDEFQDTNITQNELVVLLAGKQANLTCVADDDQSIYKWRGAAVSNVLQFKKTYPQAKVISLVKNYRSTQEILDRAYDLIQHNNPDRLEVKEGIDKKLLSVRQLRGKKIEFFLTDRVENEAERVVRTIEQLTQKDYRFKDVAILVRANNHAEPFIRSLKRHGLPFQFLGPGQLFRKEEVKDLIAYLCLLDNFEDNLAFYKVLTMAVFDLAARDLAVLRNYSRRQNLSLFEAAEQAEKVNGLSNSGKEKLNSLVKMVQRHLKLLSKESAGQILYYFLEDSGLLKKLVDPQSAKEDQRTQNISRFFDKLKSYEADHEDASVFVVVDWLSLKLELGESPLATDTDWSETNAVNILTVHSAKGLEFPVVFLVNLVSERFPTRNRREPIPIPDELIKEILPTGDSHEQEERRLFYVGLTRAKDLVYLTASKYYGEAKRLKKTSLFVFETLGKELKKTKTKPVNQLSIFDFKPAKDSQLSPIIHRPPVTYLSYSQIEAFKRCPLQYKYRYVLRLPTPPSHQQSFGISVHNALRDFYRLIQQKKVASEKTLLKFLKQNWLIEGYLNKTHEKKAYARAKGYLKEFYQKSFDPKVQLVALEESFKIRIASDLWVGGRIDRIDQKANGKIEIIDYKTGKLMDQKEVDKSLQMTIYALAATNPGVFKKAPEQVKLTFYFLDGQQKVSTKRTKKQLEKAQKEILDIRNQIQKSDFQAHTNYLCQFCDYQLLCSA